MAGSHTRVMPEDDGGETFNPQRVITGLDPVIQPYAVGLQDGAGRER